MKRIQTILLGLLLCLLGAGNGYGQEVAQLSGAISSDTTLELTSSPYLVTGSVLVREGVKLTVEAEVVASVGVRILSYTRSPFGLEFESESGREYVVESTGDLRKWKPVKALQGIGSTVQFTDTRKALFEEQYYRVRAND